MGKLTTPDWIKKGHGSKAEYEKAKGITKEKNKGKIFKIRKCPKCKSNDVLVVLGGEETRGSGCWECSACNWQGRDIKIEEVGEEEFLKEIEGTRPGDAELEGK